MLVRELTREPWFQAPDLATPDDDDAASEEDDA
jgi:hypothetical protein